MFRLELALLFASIVLALALIAFVVKLLKRR
jgi:hypothetical protein